MKLSYFVSRLFCVSINENINARKPENKKILPWGHNYGQGWIELEIRSLNLILLASSTLYIRHLQTIKMVSRPNSEITKIPVEFLAIQWTKQWFGITFDNHFDFVVLNLSESMWELGFWNLAVYLWGILTFCIEIQYLKLIKILIKMKYGTKS